MRGKKGREKEGKKGIREKEGKMGIKEIRSGGRRGEGRKVGTGALEGKRK